MLIQKKRFRLEYVIFFIASISYINFCNYIIIELPHLSWFDQFAILNKYYNNDLHFLDLMSSYGEHGLFGYNVLFLVNALFFKLSTFFDVWINNINVLLVGLISIVSINKTFGVYKNKWYTLCLFGVSLFSFNLIQLSSGAMETQVRLGLLFYVIVIYMMDRFFCTTNGISYKYITACIILIFVSLNVFGTLYSFAGIPVIFLLLISKLIKKINFKKSCLIGLTYLFSIILYFLQYRLIGKGGMQSGTIGSTIINLICHPLQIFKGLLAYNANSILGFPVYVDKVISDSSYLWVGLIVTIVICYSIIRCIKSGLNKKTKLPILFIGYSLFVFLMTIIGRPSDDWGWYVNEWYTVHTKLQIIACVWILSYDNLVNKRRFKAINSVGVLFLIVGILYGNVVQIRRAPYVREYYLDKQPYLFVENMNQLPVDDSGLTPLLHTPEMTMNAIEIMKEHNLSVYRYYEPYAKMQKILGKDVSSTTNLILKSGFFEDGWIGKSAEFDIKTGNEGRLILTCYFPKELTGKEKGVIYTNDVPTEYVINQQSFIIEVQAPAQSLIAVKILNDFYFQAEAPDVRELSFIITDISIK